MYTRSIDYLVVVFLLIHCTSISMGTLDALIVYIYCTIRFNLFMTLFLTSVNANVLFDLK